MKAYIYQAPVGRWIAVCGTGRITPEYKSLATMRQHYFNKCLLPGRWVVQIFNNWEDRYKTPDKTIGLEISNPDPVSNHKNIVEVELTLDN